MIAGIDPGLGGAVALMEDDLSVTFRDVPVMQRGERQDYDIPGMLEILHLFDPRHCIIESVHAQPTNGSIGNFRLGYGLGIWLGLLTAGKIPYTLVTPQRWKKTFLEGMPKEKDSSRLRALQLYPDLHDQLKLKKHHGRADALFLARYWFATNR